MQNNWKKTLASFIIISFLVFLPIQITHSASSIVYILKEFTLDLIARVLARNLLSNLINNVSDFLAENGRDGLPNFVQDWRYFLEDAQYRGEDITRAIIGEAIGSSLDSGTICDYLKSPLGSTFNTFINSRFSAFAHRVDSLQYYALRNRCTLPTGFDVNIFRNNFVAGGGWAAWEQLIQPQNNIWGVITDTRNEFQRQRKFEESRDRSEAESGSGFTSKMSGDDGCLIRGGNASCLVLGNVLTPAKIFETIGSRLNISEFDWITGCDELSECIYNVLTSLTGRLTNLVDQKISNVFNADTSQGAALCVKAGEGPCYEKAKKWDCDATATGGSGGSAGSAGTTDPETGEITGGTSGSAGSGGSASTDCTQTIDQGIYDACMAEVRASCGIR